MTEAESRKDVPESTIEIRGLRKKFGKKIAVDELTLDVPKGSIFGFIGPNGAGKTTTIRILATLNKPSAGSAKICGCDVVYDPVAAKRCIGYMPDEFGVYEEMSLHEYLEFFAAAQRIPRGEREGRIRAVLELTDLGPKKDERVASFSKGLRQRACLAKTLIHDPEVLILDEPASALDPRARIEFRELLRELRSMGKTIFLSSHNLIELSELCDHVAILEAGKLVASGAVDELVKKETRRRFLLRCVDEEDAKRLRSKLSESQVHEFEGRIARFELEGDDAEVFEALQNFAAAGVRFVEFREDSDSLESAFLALTKGDLG
ncbi:MAG: ABC transporter ATP-binding protein [Planctomycetota bacterium]